MVGTMAKIDDSVKKKVPELRFKGFTDEWEERKLGEVTEKIGSGKTPKGGNSIYQNHGIALIRSQNIFNDRVNNNDIAYISAEVDTDMKNSRVFKNDVLLNITGASIGRSAVYQSSDTANVNQHVCIIRPKDNISSNFIQLNISSSNGQKEIELNQAGGGREGLNFQQIARMNFSYPSYDEQKLIGLFFKKINDTIALHQRKLDLLKEQKKGYLQKLFPKNGSKSPQLRFSGFADDWEERKLGEISKTTIGEFVIKNKQDSDAPYPVYNGGISYTGFYDEFNNEGDKIVISARGANAGFVNYIDGRFWAGNSCYSVDILDRKKFSVEFMYQFLKRNQHLFTDYQQAANIPSVSKKDVATFIVQFPTQNEQQKIGSFFKQLDATIALHQRKLDLLKEQKKGFLQKMFV